MDQIKRINWWAFFLGVFWFPYKGLWKPWFMLYIPYAVIASVLGSLFGEIFTLLVWFPIGCNLLK